MTKKELDLDVEQDLNKTLDFMCLDWCGTGRFLFTCFAFNDFCDPVQSKPECEQMQDWFGRDESLYAYRATNMRPIDFVGW